MIPWCSNYQFTAPSNAAAVSVTPSGSATVFSSDVTVFTASADCVLTGIDYYQPQSFTGFEIEVRIGSTTIATHGGVSSGTGTQGWGHLPFKIPIDAIPNGSVVKVRIRKYDTNTTPVFIALTYWKKPIVGTVLTTAQPHQMLPVTGPYIQTPHTSATPWTFSSWIDMRAFPSGGAVTGVIILKPTTGVDFILELGWGSVTKTMIKDKRLSLGVPLWSALENLLLVPAAQTLQCRWMKSSTDATEVLQTNPTFYDLPL